jgi:hypothetical protein
LEVFDSVRGFCFVLLARSDTVSAFKTNDPAGPTNLVQAIRELGFGDWDTTASGPAILEEALRIVHTVAYLHAILTHGKAPLHWVCDNDEILAGPLRHASIVRLLPEVVEKYAGRRLPCRLTTEAELNSQPTRDLLSLPDLLCAGILEYQLGVDSAATDMIAKAAVVGEWLEKVASLQKLAMRVTPNGDDGIWWELIRPYFKLLLPGTAPA